MTANTHPHAEPGCRAVSEVLSRVGDKWTVLIVKSLQAADKEGRRFNDLKRDIGGISQQMLTRSLRALERDGMVERTVHATVPPQVEYRLTDLGHSLAVPVMALADWTFENLPLIHANRAAYDKVADAA
ncbi:MAG: transcriptional regulator [Citromicrobium sp.]|nr:transcriptional regulator [Citromicrobium sp.]|tara:strand:- start:265 stop:651 length:387 start_codon:yes stop_codon:yes gene_type:complete